jgi:hypothetical protein
MKHIVLLGDSIFDNKSYIGNGLDVVAHLRNYLSGEGKATLCAIDGSVVENVRQQTLDLPIDTTHLLVSVGGNNAILNADVLQMKVSSSAEVFDRLADMANTFELHYHEMLQTILSLNKPTAVCTIYYPRIPEEFAQKITVTALATFNDVIIRQAFLAGVPLIDLRLVCNEDSDYANEIEPSNAGGAKIARTILRVVNEHNFEKHKTEVYF